MTKIRMPGPRVRSISVRVPAEVSGGRLVAGVRSLVVTPGSSRTLWQGYGSPPGPNERQSSTLLRADGTRFTGVDRCLASGKQLTEEGYWKVIR